MNFKYCSTVISIAFPRRYRLLDFETDDECEDDSDTHR